MARVDLSDFSSFPGQTILRFRPVIQIDGFASVRPVDPGYPLPPYQQSRLIHRRNRLKVHGNLYDAPPMHHAGVSGLPFGYLERLERLIELAGLTWEEFAERLGVGIDRVTAWREGTIPTGGEVWHIMRLAYSVPGGIEVMLPEAAEGAE